MLFKTLWTGIVGGEESRRSETVMQFAKIRGTHQDVVAWIKWIDAQSVANAQLNPGLGHDLHQPERSLWRDCSLICAALELHNCANPALRDREPAGCLGNEGRKGLHARCARRMRYRNGQLSIRQGFVWQYGRHKSGNTRCYPEQPEACHRARGRP